MCPFSFELTFFPVYIPRKFHPFCKVSDICRFPSWILNLPITSSSLWSLHPAHSWNSHSFPTHSLHVGHKQWQHWTLQLKCLASSSSLSLTSGTFLTFLFLQLPLHFSHLHHDRTAWTLLLSLLACYLPPHLLNTCTFFFCIMRTNSSFHSHSSKIQSSYSYPLPMNTPSSSSSSTLIKISSGTL